MIPAAARGPQTSVFLSIRYDLLVKIEGWLRLIIFAMNYQAHAKSSSLFSGRSCTNTQGVQKASSKVALEQHQLI